MNSKNKPQYMIFWNQFYERVSAKTTDKDRLKHSAKCLERKGYKTKVFKEKGGYYLYRTLEVCL